MASTHPSANSVLAPVAASERVFTGFSHASLWFSLGVGLLVIQIGAYLVPAMGTQDALLAIFLGSLLGSGLVAWVAKLGCDTGLSSAGLMHFGWSGIYLVIATVFWGSILTLLMASSMLGLVRNFVSRFGLPLVVISLAWLTWQFLGVLQTQDVYAFWNRQGNNSMDFLSAIDLVIAMPVSWLPLVADYARHGKNSRTAMSATWLGYALANIWCYSLGVLVVSVSSPDINLVSTLLLAQGGLLALGLILIDELDNAYGDVYSASLNSHSLLSHWSIKKWGLLIAVGCTLLAIVLPMHSLEPFLLMLSSVFIPLYGVILGRAGKAPLSNASRSIYLLPALIWLIGIAVFHLSAQFSPQWGSALPSLAVSLSLAWLTRANPAKDDAAHA